MHVLSGLALGTDPVTHTAASEPSDLLCAHTLTRTWMTRTCMQDKLSPAMQRRRKRAKAARRAVASEAKLAVWMPTEHTTDRILSQARPRWTLATGLQPSGRLCADLGAMPAVCDWMSTHATLARVCRAAHAVQQGLLAGKQAAGCTCLMFSTHSLALEPGLWLQMEWLCSNKRAYMRPQPGDGNAQTDTNLASVFINLVRSLCGAVLLPRQSFLPCGPPLPCTARGLRTCCSLLPVLLHRGLPVSCILAPTRGLATGYTEHSLTRAAHRRTSCCRGMRSRC